jgi:glutaredoxin
MSRLAVLIAITALVLQIVSAFIPAATLSAKSWSSVAAVAPRSRQTHSHSAMHMSTAVEQRGVVTVYHKTTCPYCTQVRTCFAYIGACTAKLQHAAAHSSASLVLIWQVLELLEGQYQLTVNKVNVLEGSDSEKKIKQMRTFSGGRNTVPQVFFNSEHLGGNDDVQVSTVANVRVTCSNVCFRSKLKP